MVALRGPAVRGEVLVQVRAHQAPVAVEVEDVEGFPGGWMCGVLSAHVLEMKEMKTCILHSTR